MHHIQYLLLALLILATLTIFLLLHSTKMFQWAADTYGPRYHLGYKEVSGTILTGIEVKDLTFRGDKLLDTLKADWNPSAILNNRLTFTSLKVSGVNVENIKTTLESLRPLNPQNNTMIEIPFAIDVEEIKLSVNPFRQSGVKFKTISLEGNNIVYHNQAIDVGDLFLSIDTNVSTIELKGEIEANHIKSRGDMTLHEALFETLNLPLKANKFDLDSIDIRSDKEQIIFDFDLKSVEMVHAEKDLMKIEAFALKNRMVYGYDDGILSIENEGNLSTPYVKDIMLENRLILKDGVPNYSGKIALNAFEKIDANLTKALENLEFTYQGDVDGMDVKINSTGLKGKFISNDFKKGDLTLWAKEDFILQYMFVLPPDLRPSRATLDMHIPLEFAHFLPLHANAKIRSNLVDMDIDLVYSDELNATARTSIPKDSRLRALKSKLNFDALSPLYANITTKKDIVHANLHSQEMESKIKLNKVTQDLKGHTVLGGAKFSYSGNLDTNLSVKYTTASVHDFLKQMNRLYSFDPPPIDGDARISMELSSLKDIQLKLHSNTLTYMGEDNKAHTFNNTMMTSVFANSVVLLQHYQTTFGEQKIFSQKPSVITFKDGDISLEPLWINNALKLTGNYNLKSQNGEGYAVADAFTLLHEKSELTNRIDIRTKTSKYKTDVEGTITILGGTIYHDMEIKTFSPDSDIVDVKEMKKRESMLYMTNLRTSIKVNTDKPFRFITDKADVQTEANIMIQKAFKAPIEALGSIKILDGSSYSIHHKKFLFKDSTINLLGDPFNPFLDITTIYKTRQIEIKIQIAGELHQPNITFSSTPHMSKKQILSTILFDVQDNTENISEENMLLMMGDSMSKSLFSNIGGETIKYLFSTIGINIDKLPFIGRSWDANQSKSEFFSFFSTEDEPEIPSHAIRFKGQKYITEKKLQKAMGVETKSLFAFWKEDKPTIINRLLPTLKKSLKNFYASEGFYNAAFSIDTSDTNVTVSIDENMPVKIENITINSDYDISNLITFKKGQIFRSKEFVSIKKHIKSDLMKEGYCSYNLESKAYVDKDAHKVDIGFNVKKGEVCTFGEVTIKEFDTIDDAVIASRIRVKKGEPFSTKQIQETYEALYDLKVFDDISVVHDRKFYNVVPVEIAGSLVKRPWYFSADVDYTSSDGFRLSTEVKRTNFLGNAKNISLDFTYSRIDKGLEMGYFVPALFKISEYYFDLTSKIGLSKFEYEGFREDKKYLQVLLGYNDDTWRINAGLVLENIDISPRNSLLPQFIEAGSFSPIYPFFNFHYDTRDSKIYPKHGYYFSGSVEYGVPYAKEKPLS